METDFFATLYRYKKLKPNLNVKRQNKFKLTNVNFNMLIHK